MKAIFEVKTIISEWQPPFTKNIETIEFEASQNEEFDRIRGNGNNESVFKVLELDGDRVKLQFSSLFSVKEPKEGIGKEKIINVSKGEEEILSYLWGEKGITKKIVYKGLAPTEMRDRVEAKEETQKQDERSEIQEAPKEEILITPAPAEPTEAQQTEKPDGFIPNLFQ